MIVVVTGQAHGPSHNLRIGTQVGIATDSPTLPALAMPPLRDLCCILRRSSSLIR